MTLAEAWEWRAAGSNPCRHVQRFSERPRTRYLNGEELQRLGKALRTLLENGDIQPSAANAIRMLLLTGARLNEILTAKWAWIDVPARVLRLPDSKSGEKRLYLSEAANDLLERQQTLASGSEFLFPGRSPGKHMINLRKPWTRLCQEAEIDGVRLHDLRHTAASIAVGQGATLPVIGRLLGHSQAQTTLRYAHVDSDPALYAADRLGKALIEKLG